MSSSNPGLNNKRILLGICAGIAAYKTPILVRGLRAAGAEVQVVMTDNAHHFVTATSLQAVAGAPVRRDLWDEHAEAAMSHIELARWADLIVIAPTTANTLAKLANGMADDLLTTLCLASSAPIWLAPAMNQQMFQHPATQTNLRTVQSLGYHLIGPESGDQACGEVGPGRMTEPEDIVTALAASMPAAPAVSLTRTQNLHKKTVMITAGPTLEAIDPVRYISNHSSGLQGIALADAALDAGAHVILIAGPKVPVTDPAIQRINVISALDMLAAVHEHLAGVDIFIGVAAVADYRPEEAATQKMKRAGEKNARLTIELVENPDIIAGVAKHTDRPNLVIGFAAETNDTQKHARQKLKRKALDAVVVNDVSEPGIGFNSSDNAACLIHADGEVAFARQSKTQLAHGLIANIVDIFASQLADTNPESVSE
ncbi:MAG: bifunctional phosphopantothenoylcysteine decarboxylase/phosphopantothenate--cysteine ligase CoaBC [Pseudomonadaceae bacterium]|nr:bifunctional phosphopantothenoylcysteine decarboxylase/phosphopantothenate--cysteine ligase CoaBC [Pseudomonadaceae bacterium]